MSQETSQNLYHKYSLINVGDDGVLFKENGGSSFLRYLCNPDTQTWDVDGTTINSVDMNSLLCGTDTSADLTALTLM